MTGNKLLLLFLLILVSAPPALAQTAAQEGPQGSVMSMAFFHEVVLQPPRLANVHESQKCGLNETDISSFVFRILKTDGIPVFSLLDAPPIDPQKARLYVLPEITTMELKDVACFSFVSFSARSTTTVIVPPISVPRDILISHWNAGVMINSSSAGHRRTVEGSLERLINLFVRDYRLAQPPAFLDPMAEK